MKAFLLVLFIAALPLRGVAQGTLYVSNSSPGAGSQTVTISDFSSGVVYMSAIAPFSYTAATYKSLRVVGGVPAQTHLVQLDNTGDQYIDIYTGSRTGPSAWMVCYSVQNLGTVERSYAVAVWDPATSKFVVSGPSVDGVPSKNQAYAQSGSHATKQPFVIGRYEKTVGGGMLFTRLVGGAATHSAWRDAASPCPLSGGLVVKDYGGSEVAPGDLVVTGVVGGLGAGSESQAAIDAAKATSIDTDSKTNPGYDKGDPGGGGLTEKGFQTGVGALGKKLGDIGAGVDRLGGKIDDLADAMSGGDLSDAGGQTSMAVSQAKAATVRSTSGLAAGEATFGAGVAGIGTTSGRDLTASLAQAWYIALPGVAGGQVDLNPFRSVQYGEQFKTAASWSKKVVIWGITLMLLVAAWRDAERMTWYPGLSSPQQSTSFFGMTPLLGYAISAAAATIMVFAVFAVPLVFFSLLTTTGVFDALLVNPLGILGDAASAAGVSMNVWIWRFVDFGVAVVPLDIALLYYGTYLGWRATLEVQARISWAIVKFVIM